VDFFLHRQRPTILWNKIRLDPVFDRRTSTCFFQKELYSFLFEIIEVFLGLLHLMCQARYSVKGFSSNHPVYVYTGCIKNAVKLVLEYLFHLLIMCY
jgi:hypothetical protein